MFFCVYLSIMILGSIGIILSRRVVDEVGGQIIFNVMFHIIWQVVTFTAFGFLAVGIFGASPSSFGLDDLFLGKINWTWWYMVYPAAYHVGLIAYWWLNFYRLAAIREKKIAFWQSQPPESQKELESYFEWLLKFPTFVVKKPWLQFPGAYYQWVVEDFSVCLKESRLEIKVRMHDKVGQIPSDYLNNRVFRFSFQLYQWQQIEKLLGELVDRYYREGLAIRGQIKLNQEAAKKAEIIEAEWVREEERKKIFRNLFVEVPAKNANLGNTKLLTEGRC